MTAIIANYKSEPAHRKVIVWIRGKDGRKYFVNKKETGWTIKKERAKAYCKGEIWKKDFLSSKAEDIAKPGETIRFARKYDL